MPTILSPCVACIGSGPTVFFTVTLPANQQTQSWTVTPGNWEGLRSQ
jgi:hypothetical protein